MLNCVKIKQLPCSASIAKLHFKLKVLFLKNISCLPFQCDIWFINNILNEHSTLFENKLIFHLPKS